MTAHYACLYEINDKLDLTKNNGEVSLQNNFLHFVRGGTKVQ
jgi:hypothetical protein